MQVTLLGSGEAVGVPAPLCACEYCTESPRRRRPGLLVETDDATVVLDVSPDIVEQLQETGTTDVDAFFVTHHHFDHVGGLHELAHAAMGFDAHVGIEQGLLDEDTFADGEKPPERSVTVSLSATAREFVEEKNPHLLDSLDVRTIEHGDPSTVGDLEVVPFPVDHARPPFDTLGFSVGDGERTVAYAPDVESFVGDEHHGADLLFVEGAALFRAYGHGDEDGLRTALADADRTILLNLNEHLQRMTTDEMAAVADAAGYELGSDFATYELS